LASWAVPEEEATMPPTWKPGVAFAGTVTVKGTITVEWARTVTRDFARWTQLPTSTGRRAAGSRSKPPVEVLRASLA
jgi:hypothetical protein